MALHRKYDIVIIVALVLAGLAYAAFTSEYRLKEDMPAEFFNPLQLAPAKRASEEKIARAYWNCAVKQVQWKYGYASRLPDEVPPEFGLTVNDVGPIAKDEAVRRHYWQQLRATWHSSNVWKTEYLWSGESFRQSLRTAGDWWAGLTRNMVSQ